MPTHHPPETWLLGHVAGTNDEAIDLLVASHATLCPECRDHLADIEEAAGQSLDQHEAPVSAGALEAVLARLDTQEGLQAPSAPHPDGLPLPLRRYLADDALAWRFLAPGIQQIALPLTQGAMPVRLLRLAPGLSVPHHTHDGLERTLVLAGGYDDDETTLVRGDVAVRDGSKTHIQRIHDDGHCIALVAADGPLVPVGFKSRVLSWFIRA